MDSIITRQLQDYIVGESYQSLLLIGNKKDGIEAAELVASEILKTDSLEKSSDFMRIALKDGEKTIGVEAAGEMIDRAMLKPANAPRTVCIVEDMDRMTVQAQNKLLKLLEDSTSMIVVGVVQDGGKIIDTVKSRCQTITFRGVPFSSIEGDEIGFFIRTAEDRAVARPYFQAVKDAVTSGKPELILQGLSMIAEKDSPKKPVLFYTVCNECVPSMVSFMGRLALDNMQTYGSAAHEAVALCNAALSKAGAQHFTKDSFFVFVAEYIQVLKR